MHSANGFPVWFRDTYLPRVRERAVRDLHVIAMTYNTVWDYAAGIVPDTPPGLTVEVVSGGGQSSLVEDVAGEIIRMRSEDESSRTKRSGAEHVRGAAQALSADGHATLVLLYAGTSRFDAMCDVARMLHERGADVALITCGCELAREMRATSQPIRERTIAAHF